MRAVGPVVPAKRLPERNDLREVFVNRISLAVLVLASAALVAAPFPAAGQTLSVAPVTPAKSGMVSYIQGAVFLNDELLPDPLLAQYPYVKEEGSIRTAEGRAEIEIRGWRIPHNLVCP